MLGCFPTGHKLPVWLEYVQDSSSLCNVFFVGEQNSSHLKPFEIAQVGRSSQSVAEKGIDDSETASKPQIGDDNKAKSSVTNTEREPDTPVPEINYLSGDDFLELLDLEIPASPSSSSGSSCVTISSDECFDALEFLQDLEADTAHNNAGLRLSVQASSTPSEIIAHPPSTGTVVDKLVSEEMKMSEDDPNRAQKSSSSPSKANKMKKLKMKYLCFMSF